MQHVLNDLSQRKGSASLNSLMATLYDMQPKATLSTGSTRLDEGAEKAGVGGDADELPR
jgi:hypothetical protein